MDPDDPNIRWRKLRGRLPPQPPDEEPDGELEWASWEQAAGPDWPSSEPDGRFDGGPEPVPPDEAPGLPPDFLRLLAIRIVALLLVLSFLPLAFGGVLRLLNLPSLGFLFESAALSREPEVRAWMQAVVAVEAEGSAGTGFNVDPAGAIVTCHHIVESADQVRVGFASSGTYQTGYWVERSQVDLALVPLPNGEEDLPFLELERSRLPRKGDELLLIGNPLGFFRVANKAEFMGLTLLAGWDVPVLVIRGPVYQGHSGSPVLNGDGRVVGVVFATADRRREEAGDIVAFAIPVSEVLELVETVPVR